MSSKEVIPFTPNRSFAVNTRTDNQNFEQVLGTIIPLDDHICAVRISGVFEYCDQATEC
jgi:alpha-acetolactate decarboxylase